MEDVSDVLMELVPLKLAIPRPIQLLQIALTISVSTGKCEQSFSSLKRVKRYLRTSMTEDRLNSMTILSIEYDMAKQLDKKNIVQKFAKQNRRISFWLFFNYHTDFWFSY